VECERAVRIRTGFLHIVWIDPAVVSGLHFNQKKQHWSVRTAKLDNVSWEEQLESEHHRKSSVCLTHYLHQPYGADLEIGWCC
jgi:hypothetical protein